MRILNLALVATCLLFGTALAQEVEKKMEFKVVVSGDGDETMDMQWGSGDTGLDLQDLSVGETRSFDSDNGESITVTRAEDGFDFNVDGKVVSIPALGEHGSHMVFAGEGGPHEEIDVRVINGGMHAVRAHHPDGVTIISGTPLDNSVKDSIRSVLISAGNNEEVTFIDGSDGERRVMIKKVEIVE